MVGREDTGLNYEYHHVHKRIRTSAWDCSNSIALGLIVVALCVQFTAQRQAGRTCVTSSWQFPAAYLILHFSKEDEGTVVPWEGEGRDMGP